jgi:hypothetical protein
MNILKTDFEETVKSYGQYSLSVGREMTRVSTRTAKPTCLAYSCVGQSKIQEGVRSVVFFISSVRNYNFKACFC